MRCRFFTISFQHEFNWPMWFLDGRSSSLLFVSIILLTILPKGMTVFKKKFSSSFNSACKSSSKLCALVPREVMVSYIFHALITNSTLFFYIVLHIFFTGCDQGGGCFYIGCIGARHGYCQRIDKQWHRNESVFQFLDSVLQSGILILDASNGIMRCFSSRRVKLKYLGRTHVGNVNL
jgi:hypothetical protein